MDKRIERKGDSMISNNLIINALSMGGFVIVNKALVKYFEEIKTPIVLSYMIDKWEDNKREDFYYKVSDLMKDCKLGEKKIQSCVKKLIEAEILIKKDFKGIPAKQYYNIDINKIKELLSANGGVKC